MTEANKGHYDRLTWPEVRDLVEKQPVVILTIGSTEDHGFHLPLNTDNFLIRSLCEEAVSRIPGEAVLLPHVPFGYHEHHMDFPGGISIGIDHLLSFIVDITTSVARHGFERILIANGHGSNVPILDLAARRTVLETEALCGSFIWPSLIKDTVEKIREAPPRGGMAHADELETSVYLYLDADSVQMDKARKDINLPESSYTWIDLTESPPVSVWDDWSRISKTGVIGDPTVATAEKGKKLAEACVGKLIELVRDFKKMKRDPRVDHHTEVHER